MNEQKKAQEAGEKNNRAKINTTKETKEQENGFVVEEFPNANSKLEFSRWATPEQRSCYIRKKINSDKFITPTEVLHIKESIALATFTETQPTRRTN